MTRKNFVPKRKFVWSSQHSATLVEPYDIMRQLEKQQADLEKARRDFDETRKGTLESIEKERNPCRLLE